MDELQLGMEPPLAVLPQSSVLFQPRKAALDNPAFGPDLEGMHFTALGDVSRDVFPQDVKYVLCK